MKVCHAQPGKILADFLRTADIRLAKESNEIILIIDHRRVGS